MKESDANGLRGTQQTDADRALSLLSDLAGTLTDMTAEMRKRNIHRIFERVDFGYDGEICKLHLRQWVLAAFGDLSVMCANYAEGGQLAQCLPVSAIWFITMCNAESINAPTI